jgi:aldose sugar dehydrogenase
MNRRFSFWVCAASISLLSSCSMASDTFDTDKHKVRSVVIAKGLANPWSIAFLPDGRMLVTERAGRLRVIETAANGNSVLLPSPVKGLPPSVEHGQGGLLDVVLHPKYAENGWIYWTYNAGTPGNYGTELARGKLAGTSDAPMMTNVEVLFKLEPRSN